MNEPLSDKNGKPKRPSEAKSPWDMEASVKALAGFQRPMKFGSKAHIRQLEAHVMGLHKELIEAGALRTKKAIEDAVRTEFEKCFAEDLKFRQQAICEATAVIQLLRELEIVPADLLKQKLSEAAGH